MKNKIECDFYDANRFSQLLFEELSPRDQQELEEHLDHCSECRSRLESQAADDPYWTKAATHLADSTELQPPPWMEGQRSVIVKLPETADPGMTNALPDSIGAPPHPELLGRLDNFEIEKEIGRGGCGVVYKGFDRDLNRCVAIKMLAPHLASNGTARKRFAREARAAGAVRHPNVVPIYGVKSDSKQPYLVMALVGGESLDAYIRKNGPFSLAETVRIAQQISAGLVAAHRQGLIHRDIKPANVLMEQDASHVMITDFGLARAANDAAITQTGWLAGTPHYMSPEQAQGADIDHRSDLFSLGSLIYFICTGHEPFRGDRPFAVIQKILNEEPKSVRAINSSVSRTLDDIIQRLLEKNPRDRFQSAEEVHSILEDYQAYLQNPTSRRKPKRIRRRKAFWKKVAVTLLAATLLVPFTIFAATFFSRSPQSENRSPNKGFVQEEKGRRADETTNAPEWQNGIWSEQEFEKQQSQLELDLQRLEAEFNVEKQNSLSTKDNGRQKFDTKENKQ